MAEIELVIKIDEEDYKIMRHNFAVNNPLCPLSQKEMVSKVANGTPLPKGHGCLGDLNVIWNKLKELEEHYQDEFLKDNNIIHDSAMGGRLYGFSNAKYIVQDAPIIIEADKVDSEED